MRLDPPVSLDGVAQQIDSDVHQPQPVRKVLSVEEGGKSRMATQRPTESGGACPRSVFSFEGVIVNSKYIMFGLRDSRRSCAVHYPVPERNR